ncbi:MAG: transglycosylase SLT domain-containing protein [Tahibacter sp.]
MLHKKLSMVFGYRAVLILLVCGCSVTTHATDRLRQREVFRRALDAVEHGHPWATSASELESYPLLPWLEQMDLKRRLDKAKLEEVQAFLARWPDTLAATDLRDVFLRELARREAWADFQRLYVPGNNRELACDALRARLAGKEKLDYDHDLKSLWESDTALPSACDPVLAWARDHALIDAARIWERIDRALETGQSASIDAIADWLPTAERDAARRIAAAMRDPAATLKGAATWPDDRRHRSAVVAGLNRLARRDSTAADALHSVLAKHFHFSEKEQGSIAATLAVYRASEFDADALARLGNLPAPAQTEQTREWRVRVALAASDWSAALKALDGLSDIQKTDAEWRYLRARVLIKLDRHADAEPLFSTLAAEANFFGFLAADWTGRDYAICPLQLAADPAVEQRLRQGGLDRALEWRAVGRLPEARREWDWSYARLGTPERRLAADLAYREGWYDRAIFALNKGDELKLYEQRFPLARERQIRRESHASGIDPAWAYSIIRAESAWVEDAHSGANALGLMQLLPGTAARVAKSENIAYSRAEDLYLPDTNIALGTRYLAQMAAKYNGAPWLASAAYNAGPAPVERWLAARGNLEPDFFIASIPYKETREYVTRVLAFSVIYDWRMNGHTLALAARLPRNGQAYVPPDDATPRKSVTCPATAAAATLDKKSPVAGEAPTPATTSAR